MSTGIYTDETGYDAWRHGEDQCRYVLAYGYVDYHSETNYVGFGIRSGIWSASSGRCKIFDDKLLRSYVAVQILPVCIADPRIGIRSDGCLDWNVC